MQFQPYSAIFYEIKLKTNHIPLLPDSLATLFILSTDFLGLSFLPPDIDFLKFALLKRLFEANYHTVNEVIIDPLLAPAIVYGPNYMSTCQF